MLAVSWRECYLNLNESSVFITTALWVHSVPLVLYTWVIMLYLVTFIWDSVFTFNAFVHKLPNLNPVYMWQCTANL